MKQKKVKIPIYGGSMLLILDESKEWQSVNARYSKYLKPKADSSFYAFYFPITENGCTQYAVAFKEKPSNKVIAHETVHLVNAIMDGRGIDHSFDNDEAQAYLTGWVFEQIEKFFNK